VTSRRTILSWYAGLLGGLLPILLLGFLYSALADRLVFVGWALAMGAVWVLLLRYTFTAAWSPARRTGAMALLAALGLGGFAALEAEHHEILDLGFRAVLPAVYHPAATRPATAAAGAGAFALLGGVALVLSWRKP